VADEPVLSIPEDPEDPASWGITGIAQRNGVSPLVAGRVPPLVKENWTATVSEIIKRSGLKPGDVAAIGFITAIRHQGEWKEMASRVRPTRSPDSAIDE